jgi:hypothetical protein
MNKRLTLPITRAVLNWTLPFAVLVAGCGEQKFTTTPAEVQADAPGTYILPPKVDILLMEDDTGSMDASNAEITQQLTKFLENLESKNWNYRFATVPLVNRKGRTLSEMLTSKHDPSWGAKWVAPYPGAIQANADKVLPQYFRTPSTYSHFLKTSELDIGLGGHEQGFLNIEATLYRRAPETQFLRPDALLAIIVLGNGNDTTSVNLCKDVDGTEIPCPPPDKSAQNSLEYYTSRIRSVKASPSLVKFYAAVANKRQSPCRGGYSYRGSRYKAVEAALTGDQNFDICSQSISSVLSAIDANLTYQKLQMRTRFLFLNQEPNPDSIKVTRNASGTLTAIPMDPINGWTYAGYQKGVYAIDAPASMNLGTGYVVELHGSGKLLGSETATVTFTPAGFKTN